MLENLLGIRLVLKMGKDKSKPKLVPYEVITALTNVQVTDNAIERDLFQMAFSLGKRQPKDYGLLRTGLFDPKTRVAIALQIGARVEPLISGVIKHFQLSPSNEVGMSTLTVTGEGIDVMLHLEEKNDLYKRLSDKMIVQRLISKYAQFGLTLEAQGDSDQPDDNRLIPRQYATDLDYIQQTAKRNGFVFYADPLVNGDVKVYWGPENRKGKPQPALTMNMGTATNVTRLNFTQDTNAAVTARGDRLQVDSDNKSDESISPPSLDIPDLASTETPFDEYIVLMRDIAKYATNRARLKARELMTGRLASVTAQGEVDTVRYGHILRAGQLVGVRGAGALYNGDYYVDKVTHNIERGKYTQSFELRREGLGARSEKVRQT